MARIIFEDMKLNKDRRQTTQKKEREPILSPVRIKEEIEHQKEIIKQQEKKEIEREEIKINEYIKSIKNHSESRLSMTPRVPTSKRAVKRPLIITFIFCIFIALAYLGGNIFEKADINITRKHEILTYKTKQFIAEKNSNNGVNFEIMITPSKKSINLVLTEPKEVSIKAEGSITLYNEFSTKAEKISAGTFVSDEEGKTYKTNSTVTIPGFKTENKKIIPGQVSVSITSFLPGDAYNGSPTSFYINSFKGTNKYNKIYGKLKSPITGGASGLVYTLDEKSKINIDNIATTSFKEELLSQVKTLVPPGYIIYPGAITFSYDNLANILSKTAETTIDINGTLSVLLLEEESLIDNIIKVSLPNIKDQNELKEITIVDLDKLTFSFINKNQSITKEMDSIPFTLSGDVNAIWNPNIDILKTKLMGVYEDNVLPVFRQDPGISSALVKIFPPWQKYIPSDPVKININIE